MPDTIDHLAQGGAVNACGTHEIRGDTDDAVPSQRSTRGQAAAQEAGSDTPHGGRASPTA
jgi:hypothetical protein